MRDEGQWAFREKADVASMWRNGREKEGGKDGAAC